MQWNFWKQKLERFDCDKDDYSENDFSLHETLYEEMTERECVTNNVTD